jgi:Rieske Fe-S protein
MGVIGRFLQENMGTAVDLVTDYVSSGEIKELDELQRGQGAIMRKGMTKIALYRDNAGTIFSHSAVCPHKGCMIRWNDGEKSWDCPCHGSRYNAFGEVLNGPTIKNLSPS